MSTSDEQNTSKGFLDNFERLAEFYDDLEALLCRDIPRVLEEELEFKLGESGKSPRLHRTGDQNHYSKYLPDPVYVGLRRISDGKRVLVAALLKRSVFGDRAAHLLVAVHHSAKVSEPAMVKFICDIGKCEPGSVSRRPSGYYGHFFVPLVKFDECAVGKLGKLGRDAVNAVIEAEVVKPLRELLKTLSESSGQTQ